MDILKLKSVFEFERYDFLKQFTVSVLNVMTQGFRWPSYQLQILNISPELRPPSMSIKFSPQ